MELLSNKVFIFNELPACLLDRSIQEFEIADALQEEYSDIGKRKELVCYLCRALITSHLDYVSVLGSHEHYKTNPAGFSYRFKCYSNAPGCVLTGELSAEHTWFIGYAWQLAACKQCFEHLGWFFRGDIGFYGLIQGRVVEQGLE